MARETARPVAIQASAAPEPGPVPRLLCLHAPLLQHHVRCRRPRPPHESSPPPQSPPAPPRPSPSPTVPVGAPAQAAVAPSLACCRAPGARHAGGLVGPCLGRNAGTVALSGMARQRRRAASCHSSPCQCRALLGRPVWPCIHCGCPALAACVVLLVCLLTLTWLLHVVPSHKGIN